MIMTSSSSVASRLLPRDLAVAIELPDAKTQEPICTLQSRWIQLLSVTAQPSDRCVLDITGSIVQRLELSGSGAKTTTLTVKGVRKGLENIGELVLRNITVQFIEENNELGWHKYVTETENKSLCNLLLVQGIEHKISIENAQELMNRK